MYFDRYLGSHAMLCRHFFSKCHVIKISKIFGDFVSLCQGLLPTSRHFEHRKGEGPGDEVDIHRVARWIRIAQPIRLLETLCLALKLYQYRIRTNLNVWRNLDIKSATFLSWQTFYSYQTSFCATKDQFLLKRLSYPCRYSDMIALARPFWC